LLLFLFLKSLTRVSNDLERKITNVSFNYKTPKPSSAIDLCKKAQRTLSKEIDLSFIVGERTCDGQLSCICLADKNNNFTIDYVAFSKDSNRFAGVALTDEMRREYSKYLKDSLLIDEDLVLFIRQYANEKLRVSEMQNLENFESFLKKKS